MINQKESKQVRLDFMGKITPTMYPYPKNGQMADTDNTTSLVKNNTPYKDKRTPQWNSQSEIP